MQSVVIAVGGAATGFALAFLMKFGIKQEPLFALVGALIGAATTIGGAAWLADRNRVIEREAEADLIVVEFQRLLKKALAAQEIEPGTNCPWPQEYRPRLDTLADDAGHAHAVAGEALTHGKALSFVHRARIRRVQFVINEFLGFWVDINSEKELPHWDERNFPDLTSDIVNECKITIAELKGKTPSAAQD
ncbi:hypothetical protein [Novosphingobium sp. JCM 18896]|uniref:hypothetical protein n=1 Tax=Novosphingobium sp. JCM 18896 TaxID=2989731 RepID=UPI0022227AAC|nr:hypothetical protein [Novosphingobium sp. JCM 18896]MCW1432508.1 hypothetical protein [Novosphingobium sp. JCM 18896]